MNRKFQRRLHIASVHRTAVQIDGDDVLNGQRGAHRGAGIDIERASIAARAAVAVVVDVLRALQHADGIHQLLLCFLLRWLWHRRAPVVVGYFVTRCFHKSHERPTVWTLTTSASAPSSASSAATGPPSINACCWMCALVTEKIAR